MKPDKRGKNMQIDARTLSSQLAAMANLIAGSSLPRHAAPVRLIRDASARLAAIAEAPGDASLDRIIPGEWLDDVGNPRPGFEWIDDNAIE
ncbi:hypothetical protein [Albidovulum sp.]|uniref:hypothetical protein n=1 Tax=Albidovulum sp. TaxID=1872424 RepID=UPI0039B8C9C5